MKIFSRICLLLLVVFSVSCKTDFEINAPAKDITVVFGLLSQDDSVHYIKINKAFIGEDDALVMAQDPANSDYGDVLAVEVEEYNGENLVRTYTCVRTLISDKEEGEFYSPNQYVYSFAADLNLDNTYRLTILNNETGSITEAQTGLVGEITILKPYFNPANPQISFVNTNGQYSISELKWNSARNGRLYETSFRFYYQEVDLNTNDTVNMSINWQLASLKATQLDGGEPLLCSYNSESFYRFLGANIPVDDSKVRLIGKIDIIISCGGDDLSTYIDLNKPSNSIIQERPAYTNVANGIGIFSCRRTKVFRVGLSAFSKVALIDGDYTRQLNFQ